jgi:carotenoid cleavage dioxygenase-like enzyme
MKGLFGSRYFQNGPGMVSINGRDMHPFDSHGFVRRFSFNPDGSVSLKARFVKTGTLRTSTAVCVPYLSKEAHAQSAVSLYTN